MVVAKKLDVYFRRKWVAGTKRPSEERTERSDGVVRGTKNYQNFIITVFP